MKMKTKKLRKMYTYFIEAPIKINILTDIRLYPKDAIGSVEINFFAFDTISFMKNKIFDFILHSTTSMDLRVFLSNKS